MNTRTLIITAGAIVALAAPAVANARIITPKQPTKHSVKKHAGTQASSQVARRQGKSRQIYIYSPGPASPVSVQTQREFEDGYNQDLVAHGLDPIVFPDTVTASAPDSSPATSETSSATDTTFSLIAAANSSSSVDASVDVLDDC